MIKHLMEVVSSQFEELHGNEVVFMFSFFAAWYLVTEKIYLSQAYSLFLELNHSPFKFLLKIKGTLPE